MKPILLGLVNALVPGLAYRILRTRVVFGVLLLLGFASWIALITIVEPTHVLGWNNPNFLLATTEAGKIVETLCYLFAMAAFAYDAYTIARAK